MRENPRLHQSPPDVMDPVSSHARDGCRGLGSASLYYEARRYAPSIDMLSGTSYWSNDFLKGTSRGTPIGSSLPA